MSSYGSSPVPTSARAQLPRERLMSYAAAGLGLLMFVWGFLNWLKLDDGEQKQSYAGYAFGSPAMAVIGFSVAAGVLALVGAMDRRPDRGVPSGVPVALATTSLLLVIGLLVGKGMIAPKSSFGADVKVDVGLILAVITAIVQAAVLGLEWLSRQQVPGMPPTVLPAAYPGQQGTYGPPPDYGVPSAEYGRPGTYPPPTP
ncbi:MAG: hypothetical protein QOG80_159 [Pseudonocardiales bacterium]|nr:hypothetical protein [Pseudonocardiales bacterium]